MFPTRLFLIALAVFTLSAGVEAAELSVFAAASLKEALTEIGGSYEKASGDKVVFNFGASSTLARQIEQGGPADVFFSADEAKIDALEKKGLLLPGTRRSLLTNTLVIVVASDAASAPKSALDLAKPEIKRIALAEPASVPAGIYAREYLEQLGVWMVVKAKVVPTENVRAAIAAVESGNVEVGMVYKTDALVSKKVRVAVEIPANEGPNISYPVAVVSGSKQLELAMKFAAHLAGPAARAVFEKFGFGLVK
jgi:molybdate transport system substrate-binding protein